MKRLLLEQILQRCVRYRLEIAFDLAVDLAPDRIPARLADEAHAESADGVDELGLLLRAAARAFAAGAAASAPAVGGHQAVGGNVALMRVRFAAGRIGLRGRALCGRQAWSLPRWCRQGACLVCGAGGRQCILP